MCNEGNANKKLLLELDCVPRLLKLISNENRIIRRDAILVLGSMSKYCELCSVHCLLTAVDHFDCDATVIVCN